jgi:L-lysine exporter family protein LysE/ArgO
MDLGLVNVVTLRISLTRGATPAFFLGLGSIVGDLIYFSMAILGATALLDLRSVRLGLWIFGSLTMLLLAARSIREIFHPKFLEAEEARTDTGGSLSKMFVSGAALALASPTAILWFAAVGGSVIAGYGEQSADNGTVLIFASGFAAAGVSWAAALAYGAGQLKARIGANLVRGLSIGSAALFLYFAAGVFLRGWREFYP